MSGKQIIRQALAIVELRTKIVSLGTFAAGSAYAWYRTHTIDPLTAMLMFLAVLALDMGTTAFNSYFDHRSGVDRESDNREADKVLVHEGVAPSLALHMALGLFGLAGVLGLVLIMMHGPLLLVVGGFGMIIGFAYSGGPYPISRTPFGELAAGGCLGSLLFLTVFFTQTGLMDVDALLLSLVPGALVASILAANNACDRLPDTLSGRRTIAVLTGSSGAVMVFHGWVILGAGAMAAALIQQVVPMRMTLFWTPALGVYLIVHLMVRRAGCDATTKTRTMQLAAVGYGIWSLLTMIGLVA